MYEWGEGEGEGEGRTCRSRRLQLFGGGPNAPAFACKTEALTNDFVLKVPYSTKRLEQNHTNDITCTLFMNRCSNLFGLSLNQAKNQKYGIRVLFFGWIKLETAVFSVP